MIWDLETTDGINYSALAAIHSRARRRDARPASDPAGTVQKWCGSLPGDQTPRIWNGPGFLPPLLLLVSPWRVRGARCLADQPGSPASETPNVRRVTRRSRRRSSRQAGRRP
jgi:hypothetical protein